MNWDADEDSIRQRFDIGPLGSIVADLQQTAGDWR